MDTLHNLLTIVRDHTPKPLRQDFKTLLIIFVAWVCVVIGVSYFASNELYGTRDYQVKAITEGNNLEKVVPPEILEGLVRWDAFWYLDIAIHGYAKPHPTDIPGFETNRQTAFFPLYPALIKVGMKLGMNPALAGIAINIVLSFGAMLFIYLIALEWLKDKKLAMRAALLFLFLPASFFLISPYSEAVFCFLSFGAFYFAARKNWLVSNIFLAFSTMSRSAGLLVALCVFLMYLHDRRYKLKNLDKHVFTFLLAPLGIIVYALYLWVKFHDPILMLTSQQYWSQGLTPNVLYTFAEKTIDVLKNAFTPGYNNFGDDYGKEWINLMTYGSFVITGTIAAWAFFKKKLAFPYFFYITVSLLYFISKGNFISVNRYILPLFPLVILIVLYTRKNDIAYMLLLALSAVVMCFTLVQFSISYWAG